MKNSHSKPRTVTGVFAPAPKPTALGAFVVAALATLPLAIAVLMFELLS